MTGLGVLALEPHLLWWLPVYLPLTGATLWLVRRGDERSVASGLLTIIAPSSMAVTIRAATPADSTSGQWELAGVCLAYFFGTVLYVKTLIRERGKARWLWVSVGYHLAVATAAAALAVLGGLTGAHWSGPAWAAWAVLAAVLLVRAWAVPAWGPMRGRTVTPKQAGIGEAVASTVLGVLAVTL